MDLLDFLETTNQLFEAGIAITALSLFIRALTFNLSNRVSRAFAVILACVVVSFSGEAISGAVSAPATQEAWLRYQWLGTIFLPAAYMHFSDALLETTGRPSRGRRRLLVRISYLISAAFLIALPTSLVGPLVANASPLPHLGRTSLSWLFTAYYALIMLLAGHTIWRARRRTSQTTSYRRMTTLFASSLALAVGSYPFLLLGSEVATDYPEAFLSVAAIGNIFAFAALISLAYATAFFGIAWPDRVIRGRLLKWLLRGPLAVFAVFAIIPLANRLSDVLGSSGQLLMPIAVALTVLFIEHSVTLMAPIWERWIIAGGEDKDVHLLQSLQVRLLTSSDLRQFLEAVLSAVCDRFQTSTAFVAALNSQEVELLVEVGDRKLLGEQKLAENIRRMVKKNSAEQEIFSWGDFWLTPLLHTESGELIGLMGVLRNSKQPIAADEESALVTFGERAAMALDDRRRQRAIFQSLEDLSPRIDKIQRLRAASRYDQSEMLKDPMDISDSDMSRYVKDALNHYWGGPKLTDSPLRGLLIVQQAIVDHEGNPANAMRAILKQAIDRNRPEGESRFNAEWLLHNILEMKFLQGRKVRDVAQRLAMSEADLYRKQRVAIKAVATALLDMEKLRRDID